MKKFFYLLILIPVLLISCVKDLKEDTKGLLRPQELFSNSDGIKDAANNLGVQMAFLVYNSCWHMLPYVGGDDLAAKGDPDLRDVDVFGISDANAGLLADWAGYYATIRAANVIIYNVQYSVADQSVNDDCLGQAYFYRALSYSFLTRIWGPVPLIDKYSDAVDYSISPSPVADIYALIVSDCQKAESLLPETRSDGSYPGSRPIKGTVKSLLSQVYLTMAGWPLKHTENYALAAAKAKEVINNASTYGYELADINKLWTWAYNYENKECIFGMFYNNTAEGGNAGTMASPPADRPGEEGGWAEYFAEISFYNKFPAGPRKDVTFQTTIQVNDVIVPWYDELTQTKHPYYQKYTDDRDKYDWWGSRTQQIIRYAEVLLNYAEAQAMSAGPDASAYNAINQVRNRAGLRNLTPGLSANDFRDSVVAERAWEFAGGEPASRWFDLVRLERVEDAALHNRDAKELALKHTPTKDDYWMPYPARDKALNPNLKR